jgi:hypothetical protein
MGLASLARAEEKAGLPPGWLPVARLDGAAPWGDVRKIADRIHLFLPDGAPVARGVFVCYVFHSADPREVARLWRFALVTVPTPFEYDLGFHDRRNPRPKQTGLPKGDMSVLLRYLDAAAGELKRPEPAAAPIVGWLGQNGAILCADLFKRAPDRVLGDRIVGEASSAPWQVSGVKLERGLRALFAVGVAADGKRCASRPAIVVVE